MEQLDINNSPANAGLVSQHAPEVNNDSADRQVVANCKKLFESAKLARSEFDKNWEQRMDFYKGKQWDGSSKKPVMNIIRSTIQTILPLLTDAKPGINVVPAEPNDFEFAKTLQTLVEIWWDKPEVSMSHTLLEPLMDMSIFDAGVLKIFWDETAENNKGDVRVKSISPKNIFVNKEAKDFDKECYYVIERQYPTVAWLKRKFPESATKIKSDEEAKKENVSLTDAKVQAPNDQRQPITSNAGIFVSETDCRETAECWEIWIDSEEMEAYEESGEQGYKRKYPNGKLVTILPNQNLLLQETSNPYNHGKKPYVRFVDSILPHSFWGEGEVECLMSAQKNINMVLSNVLSYLKLMSNPIWKLTSDSGVKREDITNDVALVLEVDPGHMGDVQRDIPPAMQAGIMELYNTMLRNAEVESGVNDSTQGRRPVGVTAAAAIDTLQEASFTRIRLKERNMQVSLTKLGDILVKLFMQFYNTPRVTKITGGGVWPSYFEYFIEDTGNGYVFNKKDINFDEASQSYIPSEYKQSQESAGIFDITIVGGTSLPFKKAERANLAMKLSEMGKITDETLLKFLDFPNIEQELSKMNQLKRIN